MPKNKQLNVEEFQLPVLMFLKLFLLSVMNVHRFGKDRVTVFSSESGQEPDTGRTKDRKRHV